MLPGPSSTKEVQAQIKRPRNPFLIYRNDKWKEVSARLGQAHQGDISKEVGKMWKSEPKEVQAKYEQMAAFEKSEHARLHPDYKYQPKSK
ncbi:high mobility group box domain-containing protein, partial [Abortiporus biennis]